MQRVFKSEIIIYSLDRIFKNSTKKLIMDNDYSSTSRPPCPSCGSRQILKNGSTHHKKQKFLCKECGRQFIEKPEKKQITSEQKQRVKKLLLERISLRGITRSLEISMTWLQQFINNLYCSVPIELRVTEISDLEIEIECDELWSYVNSKENPVYIWLAIARKTRQIVGFYLGDRSRLSAIEFWKTLPKTYQNNGKFYTDLWESYCDVLPRDRHYPSTKKSGETTRIERLNNTLRHRCSRLVRKNLAFSKNFFNHEGAILYFIHHYNEEILST